MNLKRNHFTYAHTIAHVEELIEATVTSVMAELETRVMRRAGDR